MTKVAWVSIFLLAIFLRFYQLGSVPVSLYWDEVAIAIDAKSIAETGQDIHGGPWYQVIFPSYGDYKLPGYIWATGVVNKIIGSSNFATRLPSALAGLGTILVVGWLAKELTNSKMTALASMLVVAVSPWSVLFSRTAFEGHLAQFLLATSILFLLKSLNKESLKHNWKWILYLTASVLLGSLATYTYFSVRFIWLGVIGLVFVVNNYQFVFEVKKKSLLKDTLKNFALFLLLPALAYWLTLQPMFRSPLYDISNQYRFSTDSVLNGYDYPVMSNQLRELAGNSPLDRLFFHRHWLMLNQFAENVFDNLDLSYMFVEGDPNLRHGTGEHGLFLLPFLPILGVGLVVLAKNHPQTLAILVGWWLLALVPASVPETTPHALRSLNALVPSSLIIGAGLARILAMLEAKQQLFRNVAIVLVLLVIGSIFEFGYHYFTQYPYDSAKSWQSGYPELTTQVLEIKDQVDEIRIMSSEERLNLWLMNYGPYSPQELQTLEKKDYKVTKIDNIQFANYDWLRLKTIDHSVAVIGRSDYIYGEVEDLGVEPRSVTPVKNVLGEPMFAIAVYDRAP